MSLLYTHSRELTSSLNELKEPSSNTDWILFGYEGDDITLVNSGCKHTVFYKRYLLYIFRIIYFKENKEFQNKHYIIIVE